MALSEARRVGWSLASPPPDAASRAEQGAPPPYSGTAYGGRGLWCDTRTLGTQFLCDAWRARRARGDQALPTVVTLQDHDGGYLDDVPVVLDRPHWPDRLGGFALGLAWWLVWMTVEGRWADVARLWGGQ